MLKKILKEIKKYPIIFIARHIGADPDALSSQLALKEVLENNYPKKQVYAVGVVSSKFQWLGRLDNIADEQIMKLAGKALLIVLDTPDKKRIDTIDIKNFAKVLKIDHHPPTDEYFDLAYVDDKACSTAQIIIEFIFKNRLKINKSIAEKLYIGVVSDSNRFMFDYTSVKTFDLVLKLIKKTNLNFTALYENLYLRPISEIRFQGYIYNNIILTENRLGYLKLNDKTLKEHKIDASTAGNMINSLSYIDEMLVWVTCSEDVKNNVIKVSIRSRGPIINEVAARYNGGGHIYASGARLKNWDEVDNLIEDLDEVCASYEL